MCRTHSPDELCHHGDHIVLDVFEHARSAGRDVLGVGSHRPDGVHARLLIVDRGLLGCEWPFILVVAEQEEGRAEAGQIIYPVQQASRRQIDPFTTRLTHLARAIPVGS